MTEETQERPWGARIHQDLWLALHQVSDPVGWLPENVELGPCVQHSSADLESLRLHSHKERPTDNDLEADGTIAKPSSLIRQDRPGPDETFLRSTVKSYLIIQRLAGFDGYACKFRFKSSGNPAR